MSERTAVLLLAHGTPDCIDEIPEYLSNVTGGRPMPQAVIEEIQHRYSLIGHSPLTEITQAQGRLLAQRCGLPVYVGMRNWKPYIRDVVAQMRADGIASAVVICLAPQNSRTSVGLYRRAVLAEAKEDLPIEFIAGWADHPRLADAFAERLRPVLERFASGSASPVPVLFTAHSVPCRTIQVQPPAENATRLPPDPYPVEAKHTAELVAQRVGLPANRWFFAFQSQGVAGGPWIGPTVEDSLSALHQQGAKTVILQPIGFLCDHVEILYDVDIAFRQHAAGLGMDLHRPESLNESALLVEALHDLAQHGLARLSTKSPGAVAR